MKKLVLIEGLPGTGKTTTAKWLSALFAEKGITAELLLEGDARIPLDFYQTAGVPRELCPRQALDMAELTENYVFIRLDKCPGHLADELRRWDMGDERNTLISVEHYMGCALERLGAYGAQKRGCGSVAIVDSGFLQNPINELLFRGAADSDVRLFIRTIADTLRPLGPVCVYLRRGSAHEAIEFAKNVKGREWARRVEALLANSGCANLFERRFTLELELLHTVEHIICEIEGDSWSGAKTRIAEYFGL